MAFNFPATPALDDSYTSGDVRFRWNGYAWVSESAPMAVDIPKVLIKRTATNNSPPPSLMPGELGVEMGVPTRLWVGVPLAQEPTGKKLLIDLTLQNEGVIVSDTPPPTPIQGQLWWESDAAILWLYYQDIDSAQWVMVSGVATSVGSGAPVDVWVNTTGDTMTGPLILPPGSPMLPAEAAHKTYVDQLPTRQNLYTSQQSYQVATLTDGATIAWNCAVAQKAKVTLAGNRTMGVPTNVVEGTTYFLWVTQDATGSRSLSFPAAYNFGAVILSLSTAANYSDLLTFEAVLLNGSLKMRCTGIAKGYA